jgi:amidohydrolase
MSTSRSPYDPPTQPYSSHLERLVARLETDIAEAEPLRSDHAGAPADLAGAVTERVESVGGDLVDLSHAIHDNPELGYEEHDAVAAIAGLLGRHGHDAQVGAYDVPTALRARAGSGRPRIAVLAEYDALPGIGHACGHNIIAATAVGAFLGVAGLVGDLDGSVELIGTPAEEGGGGKELIARAGGFDEVDAAIMLHPMGMEISEHPWLGVRQVTVTYHGLSAHASVTPFMGRNALDAVVTAYNGMSQLRQHMLTSDRVHGVITDGGQRPNIVPERAEATFYLRSAEPDTLAELADRAREVFEAAALATGTQVELNWDPCPVYLPVRSNHALAARYATAMGERERKVLPEGVVPPELTGSTDMGNVCVRVPGIHPTLAIAPPWVSIHTAEFATYAAGADADRGTVDGAVGLARTAVDFLTDADLRRAVVDEFEAAGGVLDVDELLG